MSCDAAGLPLAAEEDEEAEMDSRLETLELGQRIGLYLIDGQCSGIYSEISEMGACSRPCDEVPSSQFRNSSHRITDAGVMEQERTEEEEELEELFPLSVDDLYNELKRRIKKSENDKPPSKENVKWGKKGKNVDPPLTKISKAMTAVLRHDAVKLKVAIRPDGYALCSDLMELKEFKRQEATLDDMKEVVASSDKQRFQIAVQKLSTKAYWVRAVQGHSMPVINHDLILQNLEVTSEDLPEEVVHGTYMKHWESIREKGLLAGGNKGQTFRSHVHFAIGLPEDGGVISGMRMSCDLALYMDLKDALAAGLPVLRSNNKVYLSPGVDKLGVVPFKFITKAIRLKDKQQIWPEPI